MAYLATPSLLKTPSAADRAPESHDVRVARRQSVLPWPDELLTLFSLRMSSHGMSISRIDMTVDAHYALQQLTHARDLGDPTLALVADELFRCFEAHQSGLPWKSH